MKSCPPKISIITVVKNDEEGLLRTLHSALEQNFANWELLIKDGGSSDGSVQRAMVFACSDPRIQLLPGTDSGIYDAMNQAVARAAGTYCMMLNAGDCLAGSNALGHAWTELMAADYPDIGYFGAIFALESGRSFVRPAKPTEYIRYGQPASHQATLYRTEVHKGVSYPLNYRVCSDYVATALMVQRGARALSSPAVLSCFEVKANSQSFRLQSLARAEFDRAIHLIWSPPFSQRVVFRLRRLAANLALRLLMNWRL